MVHDKRFDVLEESEDKHYAIRASVMHVNGKYMHGVGIRETHLHVMKLQ